MALINKGEIRTTTQYSFNVGYVFIVLVGILVLNGTINGNINSDNLPNILDSLLYPALGFFGIGAARVTAENVSGVKRDANGVTSPPEKVPEVQVNDVKVESTESIIKNANVVNVDEDNTPPAINMEEVK